MVQRQSLQIVAESVLPRLEERRAWGFRSNANRVDAAKHNTLANINENASARPAASDVWRGEVTEHLRKTNSSSWCNAQPRQNNKLEQAGRPGLRASAAGASGMSRHGRHR